MAPHGDGLVLRTIDWLNLNCSWHGTTAHRRICRIAYLQHRISKREQELEDMRVRHELFERRWPIYEATMKFVAHVLSEGSMSDRVLLQFNRDTANAISCLNLKLEFYIGKLHHEGVNLLQPKPEDQKKILKRLSSEVKEAQ
jgi:hypothetical protein